MIAKKLEVYCPNCEAQLEAFTLIAFTEDFKVMVKAECCGHELQAVFDVLSLMPTSGTKEKTH